MWRLFRGDRQVRTNFLFLHLFWLLIIIASIFINNLYSQRELEGIAVARARVIIDRNLAFRNWASSHGGVYVPVTGRTRPSPFLAEIPERDVVTPSKRRLTLINPAEMVRQLNEDFTPPDVGLVRISSLWPINLENLPDPWEKKVLHSFDQGATESLEFTSLNQQPHLRYMKALVAEEPCLKCHADNAYQIGEVRGGISLALPLAALLAGHEKTMRTLYGWHLLIYLVGAGLLFWGQGLVSRRVRERDLAIEALAVSEEKFRTLADFTYAWEYWLDQHDELVYVSPSVEEITGYASRELMHNPELILTLVVEEQEKFLNHLRQDKETVNCEFDFRILTKGGEERWLHHICRPIYDPAGKFLGRRASNYEITEQKRMALEKEALINELQRALGQVKLLSGFLPICANCKKIRDDKGYWNQIEAYISNHSAAVFSHGICPDCKKLLYPEFCQEEDE